MPLPSPQPHISVMAQEALEWLAIRPDGVYVDATAGAGGHAAQIAAVLNTGRLIAIDRDPMAVAMAGERLAAFPQAEVVRSNYGQLNQVLSERGCDAVDGVLIDAGCSSMQLDTASRGFSFQGAGPLDMRMDTLAGESAAAYLARVDEADLAQVLRDYGDVPGAGRIARAIKERAAQCQLETTEDLAAAVQEALPFVKGMPDEVRTVFQAIRIAVNDELVWLDRGVREAVQCLAPKGRIVVITFHSGEDRVVKNTLRELSRTVRERNPDGRDASVRPPVLHLLTPKPVLPTEIEMRANPRSKSAKLRAAEKIAHEEG